MHNRDGIVALKLEGEKAGSEFELLPSLDLKLAFPLNSMPCVLGLPRINAFHFASFTLLLVHT